MSRPQALPPAAIPALDRRLHWLIAIGMVAMIPLGIAAEEMEKGDLREFVYNSHKAIGLAILVLATWRLGRRIVWGFPHPASRYPILERTLAHLAHAVLLAMTILAPVSGIARVISRQGRPLDVFGVTLLPAGPGNAFAASIARSFHSAPVLVIGLGLLIALHVIGALKHHFIDRDTTLTRMVG